ncbi:MAG TPA: thiamine pyrophosphate-dependent enzyme, partial [Magnetospirillaceae bacterium]|nr:thiamine pyrophosphate-dependent enzyme [Magnetospirillaceae bacterium]
HNIPVILTPMAKGMLPENHPWYAGVLFHALSDQVAETHREADLVVGVGYDPIEFNYEDWMPPAALAHLDTVPADINRLIWPRTLDVVGDIRPSLERLAALPPLNFGWSGRALADRMESMFRAFIPEHGNFGARMAISILREELPQDGIMACDVGAHTHLIGQMWRTPAPGLQLMTNGWSAMGFGVPAALAAKLCMPDRKVVCVTGDGGFLMTAGELAVARRENLSVVFVVLADRKLDLIRIKQDRKAFPNYGTDIDRPDCPTPDSIFGVPILEARNGPEYRAALRKALGSEGPWVVEAKIHPGDYDNLILRKHK